MYGLHLFILSSRGHASFTVHLSSLISFSSPTTLVCLPSSCLLCILHLSISFHTCCHAGTCTCQHGSMGGCRLNSIAFGCALSKEESCLNAARWRQSETVLMRCYLALFCIAWSNASKKMMYVSYKIWNWLWSSLSRNMMKKSSPVTFLSTLAHFYTDITPVH